MKSMSFEKLKKQDNELGTQSKPKTYAQDTQLKLPTVSGAINKQKRKTQLNDIISSQNLKHKRKKICVIEVDSLMENCIKLIEKTSPSVLANIVSYIHCDCDTEVRQEMALWRDDYQLNLVHYAIIYKRPEIVQYLLAESCVFSPESQPAICPYAHLAAYMGATASMKIILTQRQEDYFKSQLPCHDIKLPIHLIKRIDSNNKLDLKKRSQFDEVLESINAFKKSEESRGTSNVRSDELNDLITHLQKVITKNPNTQKSLLPPIKTQAVKKKSTHSHHRIVKPQAYNQLFMDHVDHEKIASCIGKTPLTLAAERCHADTVNAILEVLFSRKVFRKSVSYGPLLMATKSMSPEAILSLLQLQEISNIDYHESVLEAIRQLLPDCMIALLTNPPPKCKSIFDGANLYHMVYTQCMDAGDERYQMLPVMTRALIYCEKDVNTYTKPNTFPLYSLITNSFNASSTKKLYDTFECLQILLEAGANPYFIETSLYEKRNMLMRPAFSSIFDCIFENTSKSLNIHTNPDIPLLIMKNTTLLALDTQKIPSINSRCYSHKILFGYLEKACSWGLDKQILTKMLCCCIDPNETINDRYAVNIYFDSLFKYVLEFEISQCSDYYKNEMDILIILCQHMIPENLREAAKILLNQYIRGIPVEAVPVTRYFLYLVDGLIKHIYFK